MGSRHFIMMKKISKMRQFCPDNDKRVQIWIYVQSIQTTVFRVVELTTTVQSTVYDDGCRLVPKKEPATWFLFLYRGNLRGLCTELRLFIIFIVVVSGIIPILDGHCHQKLCIILFPFSPLHLGFSHCHKLFILQRTLFLCTLHTFRFPFSQRLLLLYRSIHLKCSFRNVHTFIL